MTKRALKTDWTDLFDPFQAGRVRDAIAELARAASDDGYTLTEADALPFEKRLIAPLDAYMASQKVPGVETEKLALVLVDICDRIRENTLCAHHADNWFKAWQAFVVGGAAHLIYDSTARRSLKGKEAASNAVRPRALPSDDKLKTDFDTLIKQGKSITAARSVLQNKYASIATPQGINKAFRRAGIPKN